MSAAGMLLLLSLVLPPVAWGVETAAQSRTSCIGCHGDPARFEDESMIEIVSRHAAGVHAAVGLSCHDCHGGNPDPALSSSEEPAMDPGYTENPYRGAPKRTEIPEFCGHCHSDPKYMKRFDPAARVDQTTEYWTSRHGELLREGDSKVATCVDCHTTHGVRRPSDPDSSVYPTRVAETCQRCHSDPDYMAGYETEGGQPLPVDQYERWRRSVHAEALLEREDLSSPTCNDCHGNHGATPPGLESIVFVCGQCHGREANLFRDSPKREGLEQHNEAFLPAMGEAGCGTCHQAEPLASLAHVDRFTECSTCHENHAVIRPGVALLGALPETPCAFCHETPQPIAGIHREPERMRRRYVETRSALLAQAEEAGLRGDALFDWLVERARELPPHLQAAPANQGEVRLAPEFRRLFEKFRIGPIHFTYDDPASGAEVKERVTQCTDCHAPEPAGVANAQGYKTARRFLSRMRHLTTLTARAERILLSARRGGVEVSHIRANLDRAIDAQIELQALVHTFSTGEEGAFMTAYQRGLESARAAIEAGHSALEELRVRRRGLAASLVIILAVLIGLALKIREVSRRH